MRDTPAPPEEDSAASSSSGGAKPAADPLKQFRDLLPAPFWLVKNPFLWDAATASIADVARAVMGCIFTSARPEAQQVGYEAAVQTAAWQHLAEPMKNDKQWRRKLGKEQLKQLQAEAAVQLFSSPPVRGVLVKGPDGKQQLQEYESCIVLRQKQVCRTKLLLAGYPYLVLQRSNMAEGQPLIKIKMADIIAHFSLRPGCTRGGKDREVLCHYDVVVPFNYGLQWEEQQHTTSCSHGLPPTRRRCYSRMCCSPLCLMYSTQSHNAKTGKQRQQLQTRQARGGKVGC